MMSNLLKVQAKQKYSAQCLSDKEFFAENLKITGAVIIDFLRSLNNMFWLFSLFLGRKKCQFMRNLKSVVLFHR